jgi:hypothetical protein
LPIDGIEPAGLNLLEVSNRRRKVITKVMDDALDCSTVKKMPVRVG